MMTVLLTYSISAYLFSGWVCYKSFVSYLTRNMKPAGSKQDKTQLINLWVVILWPIWVGLEINGVKKSSSVKHSHDQRVLYPITDESV